MNVVDQERPERRTLPQRAGRADLRQSARSAPLAARPSAGSGCPLPGANPRPPGDPPCRGAACSSPSRRPGSGGSPVHGPGTRPRWHRISCNTVLGPAHAPPQATSSPPVRRRTRTAGTRPGTPGPGQLLRVQGRQADHAVLVLSTTFCRVNRQKRQRAERVRVIMDSMSLTSHVGGMA